MAGEEVEAMILPSDGPECRHLKPNKVARSMRAARRFFLPGWGCVGVVEPFARGALGIIRRWAMQTSLIIESNGSGKEKLEDLLGLGWVVASVTPNHGKSYNDFLVILEK